MNKKSIFTVVTVSLMFLGSYFPSNASPIQVIQGQYSGQFKIEGITPTFNSDIARELIGKTIDSKSELFKKLKSLDSEYNKYYQQAECLSEQLFESAMQKDEEERGRDADCVNFNYDNYISKENGKQELDELWEKLYAIKDEMRKLIFSNFNL